MSRETFHSSLSDKEKRFWKAMSGKFGKLKYEGEKAPKKVPESKDVRSCVAS